MSARPAVLRIARLGLLVAIVGTIHVAARRASERSARSGAGPPPLAVLRIHDPEVTATGDSVGPHGAFALLDARGEERAFALTTSPEADDVIGFSGPTDVLIRLDGDGRVRALSILVSGDTPGHVALIRGDPRFLAGYEGLDVGEISARGLVDGVSGATLTCAAIHDAVLRRLGGERRSSRFMGTPPIDGVRALFPEVATVEEGPRPGLWRVAAVNGRPLGDVASTAPFADDVIGFQGPTETLLALDAEGRVVDFVVGRSYENEPYIRWVREDLHFLDPLRGRTLEELASEESAAAGIEGLSGATMTSQAIAQGVVRAAAAHARAMRCAAAERAGVAWTARDVGTGAVVTLTVILGLTRWRARRWTRLALRVAVIVHVGFIAGSLVSLAMLAGWTRTGVVPWRLAPGLTLLAAAALLVPLASGRNVYCTHLCAHGALQQFVRPRGSRALRLPRRALRALAATPAALLAFAVVIAASGVDLRLTDIEPFDAWILGVGGALATTIAVGGLVASAFVPMAYCRFGCPTGALLGWLRAAGRGDRWVRRDWLALGMWGLAALWLR